MDYTPEVEQFKAIHGFEDTNFVKWHDEQLEYLKNLKDELERDVLQTDYVEALEKLAKAEAAYGHITMVQFQGYTPADFASTGLLSRSTEARSQESECGATHRKLLLAMNVADDFERWLGLVAQWMEEHEEYCEAATYLKHRQFIRVIEELEQAGGSKKKIV
ncbi:hypothetical protein K439DRAFT_1624262 [Ramaria rubella]|nr:hypothetical protein K439DRAFT_1624262 [Ramaria rubella]